MANQKTLPFYEKVWVKHTFSRMMDSLILLLLLLLLRYRVSSHNLYSFPWFVAFLCESCFTFTWVITISTKWTPAHTKTYPDRLLSRVADLPLVDLFVTTTDPELESPMITVNTVLSLLALDYPAKKLACYVSDDGCSPLTFYALMEASKFARVWVPFCKKYSIQIRAPFRYFTEEANNEDDSLEFRQEWLRMKDEYRALTLEIQHAATKRPFQLVGQFPEFSKAQPTNHQTIIKVIWENKEDNGDGVPTLIYISREKRPQYQHHYKAGAMNVLTRVSGLMTNAPIILNVDCDMHVNNPEIVLHALCILLDSKGEKEVAFVQCPQLFYDGLKNDPFGSQIVALSVYIGGGFAGLQGILYAGTNCFHRRKVIYGLSPSDNHIQNGNKEETLPEKDTVKHFGSSKVFVESARHAMHWKTFTGIDNLCKSLDLEAANQVASCGYERCTAWGEKVGWMYGSTSEDLLTGLNIHRRGWRSEAYASNPKGFMGCSPQDIIGHLAQQKRWASGFVDILLSKHSPIFGTLFGKLQFRECLAYIWFTSWALRSIPEISYAVLPAYSIITNSTFLPMEQNLWIPVSLFVTYNISTLVEYLKIGLSIRTWWNNQLMARITTTNAWFFGMLAILVKRLRMSDTGFELSRKNQPLLNESTNENGGMFIFDDSHIFVPGTTILLVQLTTLVIYWLEWQPQAKRGHGSGVTEVFCSAYLVVCYWPFFKGVFGKGKYGIPLSTLCKAMILAILFVYFCRSAITY